MNFYNVIHVIKYKISPSYFVNFGTGDLYGNPVRIFSQDLSLPLERACDGRTEC